jgi:POT family proton-dependent oligopeptide transporter
MGFGIAALGMFIGMSIFARFSPKLKEIDIEPKKSSKMVVLLVGSIACVGFAYLLKNFQVASAFFLPITILSCIALTFFLGKEMKQKELLSVIGMLALLIAYFSVEELMGSLLMVFLENHVDRNIGSVEISSSILIAINPLVVMTVGPLLARVGISLKTKTRLAISFAFLSLAFLALYLAALIELSSLLYVVIGFASIALGELFLAPTVFSFCSRVAPKGKSGLMMGLVTLAFSLASLLSGKASQLSYAPSTLFLMVSISAAFVPVLLYVGSFFQKLQSIQLR